MKNRKERNKLIVKLIDQDDWSFGKIAKEFGFKSRGTAHEIYHREKGTLTYRDYAVAKRKRSDLSTG